MRGVKHLVGQRGGRCDDGNDEAEPCHSARDFDGMVTSNRGARVNPEKPQVIRADVFLASVSI